MAFKITHTLVAPASWKPIVVPCVFALRFASNVFVLSHTRERARCLTCAGASPAFLSPHLLPVHPQPEKEHLPSSYPLPVQWPLSLNGNKCFPHHNGNISRSQDATFALPRFRTAINILPENDTGDSRPYSVSMAFLRSRKYICVVTICQLQQFHMRFFQTTLSYHCRDLHHRWHCPAFVSIGSASTTASATERSIACWRDTGIQTVSFGSRFL